VYAIGYKTCLFIDLFILFIVYCYLLIPCNFFIDLYIDLSEKYSYILDTQSVEGTVDLAVTERMRFDCSNFRQLTPWVLAKDMDTVNSVLQRNRYRGGGTFANATYDDCS